MSLTKQLVLYCHLAICVNVLWNMYSICIYTSYIQVSTKDVYNLGNFLRNDYVG
jgi:hypothetical protein